MSDLGFKPHGKRVLVQPLPPPKQVGSIVLPANALEKRTGEAVVVALGHQWPADLGLRVGDRVYTDRFSGTEVTIKDASYRLHAPSEVLAVVAQA